MGKAGIACAPQTARKSAEAMGKNHDSKIKHLQYTCEENYKKMIIVETIKDCGGIIHPVNSHSDSEDQCPGPSNFEDEFSTLNMSDLEPGDANAMDDHTLKEKVYNKTSSFFTEQLYNEVVHELGLQILRGESSRTACMNLIEAFKKGTRAKYKLVGDNIDMLIKVRSMTLENRNRDIHWFNLMAIILKVTGDHLPDDGPQRILTDVPNADLIPSPEDNCSLAQDFAHLIARSWTKNFDILKNFRHIVPRHIPHVYSEVMKNVTDVIALGIIPKSETTTEGMIEIMKTAQSEYTPTVQVTSETREIVDTIAFEGDALTEERARHSQWARSDGDTEEERIDGLHPVNADWHAIRIAYDAVLNILSKNDGGQDPGSYWYNATKTGNEKAKSKVLDDYNSVRDFFQVHVEAYIISATMSYWNISSTSASFVPETILNSDDKVKQDWLYSKVHDFAKHLIFYDPKCHATLLELNGPFKCDVCDKVYQLHAAFIRHQRKIHNINFDSRSSSEQTIPDEDHVYNYGCVTISLGLLLRNFHDAVHEGDGNRIVRVWKFLLLLFRGYNKTKYAYAALHLQAEIKALLSESKAHELIWNRTVNDRYGSGNRKSNDLKMENLNLIAKESYRHAGMQNITPEYAVKVGKSMQSVHNLVESMTKEGATKATSYHTDKTLSGTFRKLVQIVQEANIFTVHPGREYSAFPKFNKNVLHHIDYKSLNDWMKKHKRKWQKKLL
jgi:L1 cell adhesion molecule like protein